MTERLLLLDTNIVSIAGRQRPPPGLRSWLLDVGIERLAICFPVVVELMRGACLLQRSDPERSAAIRDWVGRVTAMSFASPPMNHQVAEIYGLMTSLPSMRHLWTAQRHDKHNRMGHDLMIASVAIVYDAPIITANVRDFVRINEWFALPGIYQPLEARWHVKPDRHVSLPSLRSDDEARWPAELPRAEPDNGGQARCRI